jgi:ParB/RepB/Spo0J family partition protein
MPKSINEALTEKVVPSGVLRHLTIKEIQPSRNNPRVLFDSAPLAELRANIKEHGVLVPITVYPLKGQKKFGILDGERRYKCCTLLEKEGINLTIPANIVEPPTPLAGMLYMFSIHNFREQWELMPTALALQTILNEVGETLAASNKQISTLTGLSDAQIERCRKLLGFPEKYQNMSLEIDPEQRIPSNFWIEALPVIDLAREEFKGTPDEMGRDDITDHLVDKYRNKRIKSVIHFRRVMAAWDFAQTPEAKREVRSRLLAYIKDPRLETRKTFDTFVLDGKRVQSTLSSCDEFLRNLERNKLFTVVEGRAELTAALTSVRQFLDELLTKLEGTDQPALPDSDWDDEED